MKFARSTLICAVVACTIALVTLPVAVSFAVAELSVTSELEIWLRKLLDSSRTTKEGERFENSHISLSLRKFEASRSDDQWRDFDADPITGVQDTSGFKKITAKVDPKDLSQIIVLFSDDSSDHKVRYKVVYEDDTWKIDDMTYYDEGKPQSFRKMMSTPVEPAK